MSEERSARGRTSRARGIRFEREAIAYLRAGEDPWFAVPIRNVEGGGDILAIRRGVIRLIECKTSAAGPFVHFGPVAREAMLMRAEELGASAELAYRPPRGKLRFIPSETWPGIGAGAKTSKREPPE